MKNVSRVIYIVLAAMSGCTFAMNVVALLCYLVLGPLFFLGFGIPGILMATGVIPGDTSSGLSLIFGGAIVLVILIVMFCVGIVITLIGVGQLILYIIAAKQLKTAKTKKGAIMAMIVGIAWASVSFISWIGNASNLVDFLFIILNALPSIFYAVSKESEYTGVEVSKPEPAVGQ